MIICVSVSVGGWVMLQIEGTTGIERNEKGEYVLRGPLSECGPSLSPRNRCDGKLGQGQSQLASTSIPYPSVRLTMKITKSDTQHSQLAFPVPQCDSR